MSNTNSHSTDATSEKPTPTVVQQGTPPAAKDGEEHWGTVPEEPMLPPKYQNSCKLRRRSYKPKSTEQTLGRG